MKYSKDAFGSRLEITILGNSKNDSGISESFFAVEVFEANYSRFIPHNKLSKINTGEIIVIDTEIKSLIQLCIKVSKLSQGYFDITLMPILENAGYGISSSKLQESIGYKNIDLQGNRLHLHGGVQIEFGSCGKGYMLDVIYNILSKYHSAFVINFGGDMRICGKKTILLEDPNDENQHIGCIEIEKLAIACSAGNKRKFGGGHHLINAIDKQSQNDKIVVYVTHKLGVFADSFATALFVTPLKLSLKILEQIDGLEALIIDSNGKIYKTPGFTAILNT